MYLSKVEVPAGRCAHSWRSGITTIGYAWILLLFNFFKESLKTLSNGYESVFVL